MGVRWKDEDIFRLKFLALLHDPPHKVWYISDEKFRYFSRKGHEEEARKLRRILLNAIGYDLEISKEEDNVVKRADFLAASFDRWLITGMYSKGGEKYYRFQYDCLHNIFMPSEKERCGAIERDRLLDFFEELKRFMVNLRRDVLDWRMLYNGLYSILELLWINEGLPTPLADTRTPTHTIFDHLYASATAINWLLAEKPRGYYVMIDIPGVQKIVNSSRKAGDFWAGSWMISMVTWMTAWNLIREYGPDILITPTCRLNPFYYAFLLAEVRAAGYKSMAEELEREYKKFLKSLGLDVSGRGTLNLLETPLIPATATLLLPKDEKLRDKESVEKKVRNDFRRAFEYVKTLALEGRLRESGDPACETLTKILASLEKRGGRDEREMILDKISRCLREDGVKKAFENLLSLRVYVVDVEEIYSSLLKDRKGGDFLLFDTIVREGILDEILSKDSKVLFGKPWFDGNGEPLAEYWKYTSLKEGDWIPCTQCLREPSILRFGKTFRNGRLAYDRRTEKMLRKILGMSFDDERVLRELMRIFKPGEALGPLCLLKRLLYLRLLSRGFSPFETVEDIAFNWFGGKASKIVGDLKGREERAQDREVLEYLERRGKDLEEKFGSIEEARSRFRRALRAKADEKHREYLSTEYLNVYSKGVPAKLFNDLKVVMERERSKLMVREDALEFRDCYAAMKADGDNVGKLIRGEIREQDYFDLIRSLLKEAEDQKNDEAAEDFRRAEETYREMRRKFLLSPTYYATLSKTLMVTCLKDIADVTKLNGVVIFAGGDDLLALLPVDTALKAVKEVRENYDGRDGGVRYFHRINNYLIPAMAPYGRSASLRFIGVLDIMTAELGKTMEALDEFAKRARWEGGREKDSLAISASWGREVAVLPLWDEELSYLSVLEAFWLMRLHGILSGNLPEDYKAYAEACGEFNEALSRDVASYLLKRNLRDEKTIKLIVEKLLSEISPLTIKRNEGDKKTVMQELIEAYRILRRVP